MRSIVLLVFAMFLGGCQSSRYAVQAPQSAPLSREEVEHKAVDSGKAEEAYKSELAVMDVSELDGKIEILSMKFPSYPVAARKKRIEGIVVVELVVGWDGRVEDESVIKSAHPILDSAVLDAMKTWRFKPMTYHGKPTRFRAIQNVPFVISKKG